MQSELKQKWVEALRSGKYEQGKNNLRNVNNNFCCLGVLCDLVDPIKWEEGDRESRFYNGHKAFLPDAIQESAGLEVSRLNVLMAMNDSGRTFDQIADYIEREL
jgi:hypothetical protein